MFRLFRRPKRLMWAGRRLSSHLYRRLVGPVAPIGPPVFIVGCGHSGTSLLLAVLNMHSRLYSVPYESFMARRRDSDIDWFVRHFNRDTALAGKARWVEKTPRHIYYIGPLLERFPNARVVVMLRDGRDVACSIYARTGDFDAGVRRWLADNAIAEPFLDNPAMHFVRYEDLIKDRERCIRKLLCFIGEPFEPRLLEHQTGTFRYLGAGVDSARQLARRVGNVTESPESAFGNQHVLRRSWQVSQPVFDGRGRWQRDLTDAQKTRFKELAGKQLIGYGYANDQEW